MKIDKASLVNIRRYLDDTMYSLVDFRLSFEAPIDPTGFPNFELLQPVVARLESPLQILFRLLRLGESVDHDTVQRAIPPSVLDAFARTGLLVRRETSQWRTPSLLLVPVDGLLLFVSIPPSYPTASQPSFVWFDLTSYIIKNSLPGFFGGQRVLDICCGSGVQSLVCAARGAESVTGLDLSEHAIQVARVNAVLNGVGGSTNFRISDKLAALHKKERFDFVVCNTPYAPVVEVDRKPLTPDAIGNHVLLAMLDDLPSKLSTRGWGIVAAWRSIGCRGSTWQTDRISSRLVELGFSTTAFVARGPDTVKGVLEILRKDVKHRFGGAEAAATVATVRKLLRDCDAEVEGFHHQLILFRRSSRVRAQVFRIDGRQGTHVKTDAAGQTDGPAG
jgi:methylase of polypeptide subunit release factors